MSRVREGEIEIPSAKHKEFTLVMIRDYAEDKILLGEKLRGFGSGYFNGFGGKIEPGETIEAAAQRELKEEANIEATDMTARGCLRFIFDDNPTPWLVHVFHASAYTGDIAASDEMRPVWYKLNPSEVPFERMWADDPHWWPYLLAEKKFVGTFLFTNTTELVKFWIRETDDLSTI
ncbi:7,8-dihydro-8-oxoguanine triphosphatase [Ostreococcus tauri]|uniref:Oxidized purine nucleoside triphosphate hydrolase n=1 Tax=Ostreococcus tauri TaxID=70448 RepID=Q00WF9_OSTTA|nr:7,8-dihydro-8-oxoguanine triphosphatase [Ostreococcus tauri]CAL56799.1 7,8-dihydro-8-oxoguanine triphosphatase [Ostreococcus tauri]|eukprot:XP_003082844.1 7,8-dihydro-8-oxoguanine triphosphatase [Ostreococcus tauri]